MQTKDKFIGQVINNFEIQDVIGRGGMGIVYRAYHPDLERYVAIKIMRPDLAGQPGFYERFLQEARTAARLDHPNIVDVINFGRHGNSYYLMMSYIEGPNLRQLIVENKNGLPLWDVVQIFIQIVEVLVFSHAAGVLHRDLKPDNILLTKNMAPDRPYRAMVTDFGLVKLANDSILQTQEGVSVGTPAYMSPEQCRSQEIDGRSDIYSLGVMLYEAITGQRPYPIRNLFDAAKFHSSGKLVSLRAHKPTIPVQIDNLVRRMLAPEVDKRPANAGEVVEALARIAPLVEPEEDQAISQVQMRIDTVSQEIVDALHSEGRAEQAPVSPRSTPAASPPLDPGRDGDSVTQFVIHVAYHQRWEEKVYPLGAKALMVGRIPSADIVLDRPERYVSKQHCEILLQNGRVLIRDLGSTNGTFLGEARLQADTFYEWQPGTDVHLGPFILALKQEEKAADSAEAKGPKRSLGATTKIQFAQPMLVCLEARPSQLPLTDKPITIGRAPECDLVLNYVQVSKYHCRIQRRGDVVEIMDLNSTNGTFLERQRLPPNVPVTWKTETPITIGPATIALMGKKSSRTGGVSRTKKN